MRARDDTSQDRVTLVGATVELFAAAIERSPRLGALLGAEVAEGWEGFPEALPRLMEQHTSDPEAGQWGTVFFVLESPRTLVGMGGYKGPPSPEGRVEIGYAIAPAHRGRGLATRAARALVERAFSRPDVRAVGAHTLAENNASVCVLRKLGFVRVSGRPEGASEGIWAWTLLRAAYEARTG